MIGVRGIKSLTSASLEHIQTQVGNAILVAYKLSFRFYFMNRMTSFVQCQIQTKWISLHKHRIYFSGKSPRNKIKYIGQFCDEVPVLHNDLYIFIKLKQFRIMLDVKLCGYCLLRSIRN